MNLMQKIINFDIEKFIKKISINKNDLLVIITIFLFGLVNYIYILGHTVLSPDGLTYGPIYISGGWEFDLGRPLLHVIDRIRGGLVSPSIILFSSLIMLSISAILLKNIFKIKNKINIFILSILIVLFPTFSESSLFIYCFDSYCIAFLFSILGLYFIQKKKYLLSIIAIIISLSLYQAYISVTITGILLLFINNTLDNKGSFKELFIDMVIVLLGLIAYFILLKLSMAAFGRHLAEYRGASSFGIETIKALPKSILNAYHDFYSFFINENIIYNNYYHRYIINIIIFILIIGIMSKYFINIKNHQKFLLILSFVFLPLAINIMDIIACETKINLVTAIGFIMFYILLINLSEKYSPIPIIKTTCTIIIMILCYTYLLSNNGTFQARMDTYNHYYAQSSYILNQVKSLNEYNKEYPWMFNNTINYESPLLKVSNGYLARDLETFSNYIGIYENEVFYRRFLGEKITIIPEERYREIIQKDEYKAMNTGDIKIIDQVIVIKVNDKDI